MKFALVHSEVNIAHELGYVGEWLEDRGYAVERMHRVNSGDPFTFPDADLLINLGSLSSAAAGHTRKPARVEIAAIQDWLGRGSPYVGICFGAQLLANALGGRVERQPETLRAMQFIEAPETLGPWVRWHEDFIVDSGSAKVDSEVDGAIMLFHAGNAWGVQPHLELTPETLIELSQSVGLNTQKYSSLVNSLHANKTRARESAFSLFDRMVGE